jgi:hypothetical protein
MTEKEARNDRKSEVDIIKSPVAARASGKRGPKHKVLPCELIKQWASEDMGSKAIASKLKKELGIKASYKTIQRVLSGERNIEVNRVFTIRAKFAPLAVFALQWHQTTSTGVGVARKAKADPKQTPMRNDLFGTKNTTV